MAIKRRNSSYAAPDDITHFMNTAASAGGVVSLVLGTPFTDNPDDPNNVVAYQVAPSGAVVAGVLMFDVLDYDPTRVPRNEQNPYEVVKGSKVWVKTGGYVDTNMIVPARLATLVPGPAYLAANGLLTDVTTYQRVGTFESYPDADGYVKFNININN